MSTQPLQLNKRRKIVRAILMHLLACGILVTVALPLWQTFQQQEGYQQELMNMKRDHQRAIDEQRLVTQQFQQLQDPNYLVDVARRDYYYTKSGEILFNLPEDADQVNVDSIQP